jgi:hypothetical protein
MRDVLASPLREKGKIQSRKVECQGGRNIADAWTHWHLKKSPLLEMKVPGAPPALGGGQLARFGDGRTKKEVAERERMSTSDHARGGRK